MATRTSTDLIVASFAGYYGGWASKEPSGNSGYYFGKGSSYGPLCIKFKIPSISNFATRNPTVAFTFSGYGLGYYNTCSFTATVRNSNYSNSTSAVQGGAVSNSVAQSLTISSSTFKQVTTSPITLTTSSVKADNSTYYYCWFTAPGGNYQVKEISGKVYYDAYTQCSAPTSIWFTNGENGEKKTSPYTHPSDGGTSNVYIHWSGAKAGTGMSIQGYKIQRWDATNEEWISASVGGAATSSRSLGEGERGTIRIYRIITVGTVSGYNSDASSLVYIYFNSKPTAPAADDVIIKSIDEAATIKVTIPATNYSYKTNTRTMTLWYKREGDEAWTSAGERSGSSNRVYDFAIPTMTGTSLPSENNSINYLFKMKDNFGDESNVVTVKLTRATAAKITSFTAKCGTMDRGVLNVSFTSESEGTKDSIVIELFEGETTEGVLMSSVTIPGDTTSINLLTDGPAYNGSQGLTYKFTLNVSNALGETASCPATCDPKDGISIGALPTSSSISLSNGIEDSVSQYFFEQIDVSYPSYELMTSSAVLTIEGLAQAIPFELSTNNKDDFYSHLICNLSNQNMLNKLTTSPLRGTIDFNFSLGTKITNSFTKTIYFSPRPSINLSLNTRSFAMYSGATSEISIIGDFSGFPLKKIQLGASELEAKESAELTQVTPIDGGQKVSFSILDFYPLTINDQGTIIKPLVCVITNDLGVTQTASINATLDYRQNPDLSLGSLTYGADSTTTLNTKKVCEGTTLNVPFNYTYYSKDSIDFMVDFNGVEMVRTTSTPAQSATMMAGASATTMLSFKVPAILFGTNKANITLRAKLTEGSTLTTQSLEVDTSPYQDPGMTVAAADVSGDNITLTQSANLLGSGSYTYDLVFLENNVEKEWSPGEGEEKNLPKSCIITNLNSNKTAKIKITYTYPNDTTRANEQIISYSNVFVIFAAAPTVALRKNYLGINTGTPADDAVVTVEMRDDRKRVRINDAASGTSFFIGMDEEWSGNGVIAARGPVLVAKKTNSAGATETYSLFFDFKT